QGLSHHGAVAQPCGQIGRIVQLGIELHHSRRGRGRIVEEGVGGLLEIELHLPAVLRIERLDGPHDRLVRTRTAYKRKYLDLARIQDDHLNDHHNPPLWHPSALVTCDVTRTYDDPAGE